MDLSLESDAAKIGIFAPPLLLPAAFPRLAPEVLESLASLTGVAASTSDILDEMGLRLSVPATELVPRIPTKLVVGQAITLQYLPERGARVSGPRGEVPSRLAHQALFASGRPGDVAVVSVLGPANISVIGGLAGYHAKRAGMAACVVDGGIRDLDQLRQLDLPVWSRWVTPITGRGRAEAVAINGPVCCGAVQVHPGDLVIADDSGICFVPVELAPAVVERVLVTVRAEGAVTGAA